MNIVKSRIERAVKASSKNSVQKRARHPERKRRVPWCAKEKELTNQFGCRLDDDLFGRLTAMAARMNVEKTVIVRDALRMYLDIAEEEFAKDEHQASARTHTRQPGYIR